MKGECHMNIAIYTRKSVYVQGSISIETQIEMCKDYANKKYNNPKFTILEDEGFSGGNTNRPGFQKLLKMVKLGQIDAVICYKVDRIARNTLDFLNTLELLKNNNVDLISISEGFDPNTQMGKMMLTLLASFAEMERANTQQRVKDNMLNLAKKGKWTGGTAPLGFVIGANGGLEWNNKDLISDAYRMKYEGYQNTDIITYINNHYAHKFANNTLSNTLKKPIYVKSNITVTNFLKSIDYKVIGSEDNIHGYLTYKDGDTKLAIVSDVEGIIEPSMWIKVNEDIANKNSRGTNKFNKYYWLTKTLVCPICGKTYAGHTKNWKKKYVRKDGSVYENSNTYHYYMCRDMLNGKLKTCSNTKRLKKDEIENKIEEYIYSLKDKKAFDTAYMNIDAGNTKKIKSLNKDIKIKEKQLNNLVDRLALIDASASDIVVNKINEISKQIEDLKNEIVRLEMNDININNKSDVYKNIKHFSKDMSVDEKRMCAMNIFEKIVYHVDSNKFEVYFH